LVIPICTGLATTLSQRILNFEQISAIEGDPEFRGGDYYDGPGPVGGLALARRIAHKTFISVSAMAERARNLVINDKPPFSWYALNHPVESYMLHQGEKFARRFDANSYLRILDAWQWFDLAAEGKCASLDELFLRCPQQEFLVFSIDSDASFHPEEQGRLVQTIKRAGAPVTWITVHSDKGHDSFLIEPRLYAPYIEHFLRGAGEV
jgi:homoserine O-acetyltransferase